MTQAQEINKLQSTATVGESSSMQTLPSVNWTAPKSTMHSAPFEPGRPSDDRNVMMKFCTNVSSIKSLASTSLAGPPAEVSPIETQKSEEPRLAVLQNRYTRAEEEDAQIALHVGRLQISNHSDENQCTEAESDDENGNQKAEKVGTVRFETNRSSKNSISKSEEASERRRRSENNLLQKMFSRSPRSRTIISSLGRRVSRSSRVFVQSRKGRSSFHHRITIEALPEESNENDVDGDQKNTASVEQEKAETTTNFESNHHLALPSRADSLKAERRGRSLFRSSKHKRSRAPSPGPRTGAESEVPVELRVRREYPEPGYRKRGWAHKLRSRKVRTKKAADKKIEKSEPCS